MTRSASWDVSSSHNFNGEAAATVVRARERGGRLFIAKGGEEGGPAFAAKGVMRSGGPGGRNTRERDTSAARQGGGVARGALVWLPLRGVWAPGVAPSPCACHAMATDLGVRAPGNHDARDVEVGRRALELGVPTLCRQLIPFNTL
jgi:hypothetical protein